MSDDNQPAAPIRTVKATEFRAKCLKLMDEVAESGGEIVITKNGKPVAKLTAYRERPPEPAPEKMESMYGKDRGKIVIIGDIVSPMPAEWFAIPVEYADADPPVAPIPPEWYTEPDET